MSLIRKLKPREGKGVPGAPQQKVAESVSIHLCVSTPCCSKAWDPFAGKVVPLYYHFISLQEVSCYLSLCALDFRINVLPYQNQALLLLVLWASVAFSQNNEIDLVFQALPCASIPQLQDESVCRFPVNRIKLPFHLDSAKKLVTFCDGSSMILI